MVQPIKPYLPFEQRRIDASKGHCFALSVKLVALLLKDLDEADEYLGRDDRNSAPNENRRWKNIRLRQEIYAELTRYDVTLGLSAMGPVGVQKVLAQLWMSKIVEKVAVTVVSEQAESALAVVTAIQQSECDGFLVSCESHPHTVGIVRDNVDFYLFDPNAGIYSLDGGQWPSQIGTVFEANQFVLPGWILGVKRPP